MLVPQMKKRRDRFFLRGVVSRGSAQSSNFARENQVEVLTTDYDEILRDPAFQLVVISTRHDLHADQVIRGLRGRQARVRREAAGDFVGAISTAS